MPNRVIREGLIESDRIDQLSAEGERFFGRLMLKADDFGRFTCDLRLLKAELFPLKESLAKEEIEKWVVECETAGLIRRYTIYNKTYLVIPKFGQRTRAQKSKYPEPPFHAELPAYDEQSSDECQTSDGQEAGIGQTAAHVVVVGDVVGDDKSTRKRAAVVLAERPQNVPEPVWRDFQAVRKAKRAPLTQTALDGIETQAKLAGMSLADALATCCKRGWQGFEADWLKPNSNNVADTTSAFMLFRESIRANRTPSDRRVATVLNKLGGLHVLGQRSSRDLDFMRKDFDAEYRRTAQ